ncbi:MAG: gliding motility protein GldL [Tannerellaceae bacterium]
MGKYKRYKNRIEMFLSSERGKRILNFSYSWGASIVILGAMFKLLHLPYANQILFVAMITEALVFFVSAFERPGEEYHWEDVFPVLKSKNPMDRPDFGGSSVGGVANEEDEESSVSVGGITMTHGAAHQANFGGNMGGNTSGNSSGNMGGGNLGGLNFAGQLDVTEEDTKNLSDSIKKLSGAAEQISKMAELTEASQKYLDQLSGMSDNMQRFSQVTNSLTDVSDTLLTSYKCITDNSDGINEHSRGYVQQMETLNRNISGLNTIYEIQLKGISSQIDTIEHINAGLGRIRDLYDGSVVDSSVFRSETEKMAQQLAQLNQVYSRLLQAMTVNMSGVAAANPYPPQQPQQYAQQPQQGYPQQGYGQQPPIQTNPYMQQPPYTNNPMK